MINRFLRGGEVDASFDRDLGDELGCDLLAMAPLAKLNLVSVEFFAAGADEAAVGRVLVGLEVEGTIGAREVLDEEVTGDTGIRLLATLQFKSKAMGRDDLRGGLI